MADIVAVGIAGRVYVRFADTEADALKRFQRAGARLDRERGLWFIGEHNRDAAEAVVIETFGDLTGELVRQRTDAADGGLTLVSGWVLVSAGPSGIEYRNPYSSDPDGLKLVSWDEADEAAENGPEGLRAAVVELIAAAEALAKKKPERKPFSGEIAIHGNTYPVRDRLLKLGGRFDKAERVWYVPSEKAEAAKLIVKQGPKNAEQNPKGPRSSKPATERQMTAIDAMLSKLSRLPDEGDKAAEVIRQKIEEAGGWGNLTVSEASDFIEELGDEIFDRE